MVVELVRYHQEGVSQAEILDAYPDLCAADIREALYYASEAVRERELPLRAAV